MTNSQKVKMACAYKGWTLSKLADLTGISRQNLSNKLSRDSLSIDDLQKIAEALEGKYVFGFEFPDGTKI